jgi:hypothetical protein
VKEYFGYDRNFPDELLCSDVVEQALPYDYWTFPNRDGVAQGFSFNTKTKEWGDAFNFKTIHSTIVSKYSLNYNPLTKLNQRPTLAEPQRHFTRSSLDASVAAIFGEKTSIGQVCSYAQGLKDGNVTTVPGFCCLDAPYEADYWGELVRNILFKLKSTK